MTPISPRLDWTEFWRRVDLLLPKIQLGGHVSSRAREVIQELVESALADREAALQQ